MARKKKNKFWSLFKSEKKEHEEDTKEGLQTGTKHGILAIVFFAVFVFLILSRFGLAGVAGRGSYGILEFLFGVGYFLFPLVIFLMGIY